MTEAKIYWKHHFFFRSANKAKIDLGPVITQAVEVTGGHQAKSHSMVHLGIPSADKGED